MPGRPRDRLILITYPGQPGKQTPFTYDGLAAVARIVSTPPGGGTATHDSASVV